MQSITPAIDGRPSAGIKMLCILGNEFRKQVPSVGHRFSARIRIFRPFMNRRRIIEKFYGGTLSEEQMHGARGQAGLPTTNIYSVWREAHGLQAGDVGYPHINGVPHEVRFVKNIELGDVFGGVRELAAPNAELQNSNVDVQVIYYLATSLDNNELEMTDDTRRVKDLLGLEDVATTFLAFAAVEVIVRDVCT